jgi:hypothetical protein
MKQLHEKEYKLFQHIWGNCSKEFQIILLRQQSMNSDGITIFHNNLNDIVPEDNLNTHPYIEIWKDVITNGNVLSLIKENQHHMSPDDGTDA